MIPSLFLHNNNTQSSYKVRQTSYTWALLLWIPHYYNNTYTHIPLSSLLTAAAAIILGRHTCATPKQRPTMVLLVNPCTSIQYRSLLMQIDLVKYDKEMMLISRWFWLFSGARELDPRCVYTWALQVITGKYIMSWWAFRGCWHLS